MISGTSRPYRGARKARSLPHISYGSAVYEEVHTAHMGDLEIRMAGIGDLSAI
jgi:hypothetical protein